MAVYRAATFADNTIKTYNVHRRAYLEFCAKMGIPPVPVSAPVVAQYAAFLARRLKPSSVKQYLNIVRLMHLECNEPNPCADSWYLKSTLRGIERLKGCEVSRKHPISPEMLIAIRSVLSLSQAYDAMFWAVCLVLFFGTFRRSNLLPATKDKFDQLSSSQGMPLCILRVVLLNYVYHGLRPFSARKGSL